MPFNLSSLAGWVEAQNSTAKLATIPFIKATHQTATSVNTHNSQQIPKKISAPPDYPSGFQVELETQLGGILTFKVSLETALPSTLNKFLSLLLLNRFLAWIII
ncbi:hypothetical protein H6F93_14960 [Leptolyngbya sp. FACHB-671]|uniref:hypothetical protein n=1 Tax=Leptolyngbya sp. FACHB-671 TaxID=2692812 RepID=UPI001683C579|nr:hypothetical protein [Leptolyngbya sp. FACHB-671]MBD1870322.1 hypothetical protein [Cyanobacteria bacterium FACHB-471]MBD2068808.1 hypothetical protein [Leptolyngbya sp. FACHB-671]